MKFLKIIQILNVKLTFHQESLLNIKQKIQSTQNSWNLILREIQKMFPRPISK